MTLIQFSTGISVLLVLSQIALVGGWGAYLCSKKFRIWCLSLVSERAWMGATLIVAIVSMVSSLVYSNAYDLAVCELCYYQRLCMYPQVLFLGVAVWKKDYASIRLSALILALIGAAIAGYHYYYHVLSFFTTETVMMPCSTIGLVPSCAQKYILIFGFITIPLMALIAFLLIASGLYLSAQSSRKHQI